MKRKSPKLVRRRRKATGGSIKPGETRALKHGLFSKRAQLALLPGQEQWRDVLASRRTRLTDDQGGTQNISLILEDTIDRYQRLWVLASTLEARIEKEGITTGKGKTRATVSLYLGIIDRLTKLAQQLGFERRARSVPSLQEFLKQREQGEQR
jgi:hypothetical protein